MGGGGEGGRRCCWHFWVLLVLVLGVEVCLLFVGWGVELWFSGLCLV